MCEVSAEPFTIIVESQELPKVAALEFQLQFKPIGSFAIGDLVEVFDKSNNPVPVLFKIADSGNSLIRVFLADGFNGDTLNIVGQLNRVNYRGELALAVASVNVLPDFGQSINKSFIKSRIEINKEENILQYMGISKATLIAPAQRLNANQVFVAIADIETYGFKLSRQVKAKINGQAANIYDKAIIGAMIKVPAVQNSIDIVLELEVDNQVISKKIGLLVID